MPVTPDQEGAGCKIMLVDDTPANLKLLEDILQKHQYEVRSFPRGRLALTAIHQEPPDLILLDVNMPEMNGYELCEQLKSSPRLSDIPVIFISAMNATEDKVKGFRSGGADYISKPFQIEEVQARVETHLRLRRALQAERDLLERTLNGAVGALLELVQASSPVLVSRSRAVRDIVRWIARKLELKSVWQYELAAMLSLVGCMALPQELFEKAYGGQELSPDENLMFLAHPAAGARFLSKIPRLEVVAEIIRLQQTPDAGQSISEEVRIGAHLLHLALELDRKIYQDIDCPIAVMGLKKTGGFEPGMLDALTRYSPAEAPFAMRQIMIQDIRSGMILDEDIASASTNVLICRAGTVFTELFIERLMNFARNHGVQKRVRVRVPVWGSAGDKMVWTAGAGPQPLGHLAPVPGKDLVG
jgi:putative two-component system response regulator